MERVMATFVEQLQTAGVVLPGNIQRIEECADPRHPACYVYSFGTRRMHVAARVTDSGRLLLVVRCGGGFIDFVEFVRRHGSLEHLRLERRSGGSSSSNEVIRMSSVLSR